MSILDPLLAMLAWSGLIVAILLWTRIPVVIKLGQSAVREALGRAASENV